MHKKSDKRKISDITNSLKSNPLFALSLGSRELFHSNFLSWMLEKYPRMIEIFGVRTTAENVKVEREKNNLDLMVTYGDPENAVTLVVEIKVKDAPRPDQLEKYDYKIARMKIKVSKKILLSLVSPAPGISTDWSLLSIGTLGGHINNYASRLLLNSEDKAIIFLYAKMCIDLEELFKTGTCNLNQELHEFYSQPDDNDDLEEFKKSLTSIRFLDTWNKQRASALSEKLKSLLKNRWAKHDLEFDAGYGLDNTKPHVGAFLKKKLRTHPNVTVNLGIHIQGLQYRRMLWLDGFRVKKKNALNRDDEIIKFIEETDQWKWLFSKSRKGKSFHGPQDGYFKDKVSITTEQQANKTVCAYAPKHIYQYTKIGNPNGVPVKDVLEAVERDLDYAAELLLEGSDYLERYDAWLS